MWLTSSCSYLILKNCTWLLITNAFRVFDDQWQFGLYLSIIVVFLPERYLLNVWIIKPNSMTCYASISGNIRESVDYNNIWLLLVGLIENDVNYVLSPLTCADRDYDVTWICIISPL